MQLVSNYLTMVTDEPSGTLSFNIAGLTIQPKKSEIRNDKRIPVLANKEHLVHILSEKAATYGLDCQEYDYLPALYVPLDSELVQTLHGSIRIIFAQQPIM